MSPPRVSTTSLELGRLDSTVDWLSCLQSGGAGDCPKLPGGLPSTTGTTMSKNCLGQIAGSAWAWRAAKHAKLSKLPRLDRMEHFLPSTESLSDGLRSRYFKRLFNTTV